MDVSSERFLTAARAAESWFRGKFAQSARNPTQRKKTQLIAGKEIGARAGRKPVAVAARTGAHGLPGIHGLGHEVHSPVYYRTAIAAFIIASIAGQWNRKEAIQYCFIVRMQAQDWQA
jgi:hypothetical protein